MQIKRETIQYSQNKFIAFFQLGETDQSNDILLRNKQLMMAVHHHHYPIVYYDRIFAHFRRQLLPTATALHLVLYLDKKAIRSDLPIGLYLNDISATFYVFLSPTPCLNGFAQLLSSWKKAFTIINRNKGCDYVKNRIEQSEQREKYKKYCQGQGHGFQREGLYEGDVMPFKLYFDGIVVQRKIAASEQLNVKDLFRIEFPQLILQEYIVYTHGIILELNTNLKKLLDQWSYNDGYVYLKIVPV